jgi:hypothetical protein
MGTTEYTEDVCVIIIAGRGLPLKPVTGLTTGDRLQTRAGIFYFAITLTPALKSAQFANQWVQGIF